MKAVALAVAQWHTAMVHSLDSEFFFSVFVQSLHGKALSGWFFFNCFLAATIKPLRQKTKRINRKTLPSPFNLLNVFTLFHCVSINVYIEWMHRFRRTNRKKITEIDFKKIQEKNHRSSLTTCKWLELLNRIKTICTWLVVWVGNESAFFNRCCVTKTKYCCCAFSWDHQT